MNPIVINAIIVFAALKALQAIGLLSDENDRKAKKLYESEAMNPNSFREWLSKYSPFQGAVLLRAYRIVNPTTGLKSNVSLTDAVSTIVGLDAVSSAVDRIKAQGAVNIYEYAANKIYQSKGYLLDDEKGAISVFKLFRSKAEISYLSYVFQKKYEKTLGEYLSTFLSNKDAARIYDYVNPLSKATYPPTSEVNATLQKQIFPKK